MTSENETSSRSLYQQLQEDRLKAIDKLKNEKRKNFQQLIQYHPWGKPGGGAPISNIKKTKVLINEILKHDANDNVVDTFFTFGNPGHGAPQRTKSGRVKSEIKGDPSIRFHGVQNVNKSVENGFRYFGNREALKEYRDELDSLVRQKAVSKHEELKLHIEEEQQNRFKFPFGTNYNNRCRLAVPLPDSIFSSTSPRNIHLSGLVQNSSKNDYYTYDPWGKGTGTPFRDKFGNSIRLAHSFSDRNKINSIQDEGFLIPIGKYSGGDGSPHFKNNSEIQTKLPRTLEKLGVKDITSNGEGIHFLKPLSHQSTKAKEKLTLLEKLGWADDSESIEKSERGKRLYLQCLKAAIEERNRANKQKLNDKNEESKELVGIMREKKVGHPKRDIFTGLLVDNKLASTDITKKVPLTSYGFAPNSEKYKNELAKQAEERHLQLKSQKEKELAESLKHFQTWDTFWQRPGHGAPKDPFNHRKEGIHLLYKPMKRYHHQATVIGTSKGGLKTKEES